MTGQLRERCRRLLQDGAVQVVIGYGVSTSDGMPHPIFVRRPDDVDKLIWNEQCMANLTTYLTRDAVKAPASLHRIKGCTRARWSFSNRMPVIAPPCCYRDGVRAWAVPAEMRLLRRPRAGAADEVIGAPRADRPSGPLRRAQEFLQKSPAERLRAGRSRAASGVACREVCPTAIYALYRRQNRPRALIPRRP